MYLSLRENSYVLQNMNNSFSTITLWSSIYLCKHIHFSWILYSVWLHGFTGPEISLVR